MKREFLTELGLEAEKIDKIMAEHGKTVNQYKSDADNKATELSDLRQQIKDRDAQLEELGKKAQGNEELLTQINELKTKNEQTANEYQAKLDKQAFDFALDRALANNNARNSKAVKALLNVDSIKLDGETLLGLDDQLKALRESDAYLFTDDKPGISGREPNNPNPPNPTDYQGTNPWKKETLNLTKQAQIMKDNPDLAKQLKAQAKG